MSINLNCDVNKIEAYRISSDGYLYTWVTLGVAGQKLDYGDRKEVIYKDGLLHSKTLNTSIGKPITKLHPPEAVNVKNRKRYEIGTLLQDYDMKGDQLIMASVITDAEVIDGIVNGKYTHTSLGYYPERVLNNDGVWIQKWRDVNHLSVLTPEYNPRAGKESKIILFNDATIETPQKDNQPIKNMEEIIKLWTEWKPYLEQYGKTIDYSLDAVGIKKLILSCTVDEKVLNQLNSDAIEGYFLGYGMSLDSLSKQNRFNFNQKNQSNQNQDNQTVDHRAEYIKKLTGAK